MGDKWLVAEIDEINNGVRLIKLPRELMIGNTPMTLKSVDKFVSLKCLAKHITTTKKYGEEFCNAATVGNTVTYKGIAYADLIEAHKGLPIILGYFQLIKSKHEGTKIYLIYQQGMVFCLKSVQLQLNFIQAKPIPYVNAVYADTDRGFARKNGQFLNLSSVLFENYITMKECVKYATNT